MGNVKEKRQAEKTLSVAVEDEPFPRGPSGRSCRIKLDDWLELARSVDNRTFLEVCGLSELNGRNPDIVEAFATRQGLLTDKTFPSRAEHEMLARFSDYWPVVERSGVPAIPVIKGSPSQYPVFVRGEHGTFAGGGCIRTATGLKRLRSTGRPLVVRPFVEIRPADMRKSVRLELRVHVVAGKAAAIEYLYPPWAIQRPNVKELEIGRAWVESETAVATRYADRIAAELKCRWFVADFAGTKDGLRLIELNPGWCAGIGHAHAARSVHVAILTSIFGIKA